MLSAKSMWPQIGMYMKYYFFFIVSKMHYIDKIRFSNMPHIIFYQARPGVLGIRYRGPFYFRYMVFFGQNWGIKYSVFPEF